MRGAAGAPPHVKRPRLRHATYALVAGMLLGWLLLLRPTALGGPASYVFVTGVSMEPTLRTGDLVVLHEADAYAPGDVVAFRVPEGQPGEGALVIHRIVGGSADTGFVMQGDNVRAPDDWHPAGSDVVGRQWFHVPGAGTVVAWIRQPAVFASLMAGAVVFFVVLGGGGSAPVRRRPAEIAHD
jgi:signal peptidase I